jgi:hypothetical protein
MTHQHTSIEEPRDVRICAGCGLYGSDAMWERLEALEHLAQRVATVGNMHATWQKFVQESEPDDYLAEGYQRDYERALKDTVTLARVLLAQ